MPSGLNWQRRSTNRRAIGTAPGALNMNKSSTSAQPADENAGDAALDMLSDSAPATEPPAKPAETKPVAVAAPAADAPPVVTQLEVACQGLQMPSETDAPFRTVYWPLEKSDIKPSEVALYLTENADATVKTQSISEFFKNAVTVEDWMSDDEKADAKKMSELVEALSADLENPRVYLIGEREITAAIIGKVQGGFAGVVTTIVET